MARNVLFWALFALWASRKDLGATAHVFKTGGCPGVEVLEDFDFEKFTGRWFVIEKSQTSSSCMEYDFNQKTDGTKTVVESYRLFGVKIFNWNWIHQTGTLKVPNNSVSAKMTVKFPLSLNPFGSTNFWVVATDYDQYAAIWSCRKFLFGHFQSGMILSRNRTLERPIVNKMRSRFEFYGVDKSDFSLVEQHDCDRAATPRPTSPSFIMDGGLAPEIVVSSRPVNEETEIVVTAKPTTRKPYQTPSIDENLP